jgi:uncharacterized protein (TIGR03067 family)
MKGKLVLVVAAGLLLGADKNKDDDSKKGQDALEGTWKVTSVETGGQKGGGDENVVIEFKKDRYTVKLDGNEIEQGTFKLDPTKKPKTIDFSITKGNDMGKKQPGIYDVDGDTLKICVTMPDKDDRPKEMASKADSQHTLFVLKREKK